MAISAFAVTSASCNPNRVSTVPWINRVGAVIWFTNSVGLRSSRKALSDGDTAPVSRVLTSAG